MNNNGYNVCTFGADEDFCNNLYDRATNGGACGQEFYIKIPKPGMSAQVVIKRLNCKNEAEWGVIMKICVRSVSPFVHTHSRTYETGLRRTVPPSVAGPAWPTQMSSAVRNMGPMKTSVSFAKRWPACCSLSRSRLARQLVF